MPETLKLSDAGHHFILGLRPGPTLHEIDREILEKVQPAGVILFRDNFDQTAFYADWHRQLAELRQAIAACLKRDRFIMSVDHEGGRVVRAPAPVTRFEYATHWAGKAEAIGRAMGHELASLGFNLNYAPVADINSNPDNPVIGARAFGAAPEAVARAALAFARGQQSEKVLACVKHFPGHGDTTGDSHYTLPTAQADRATLDARELVPFKAAIGASIPVVMTSHLMVPALDTENPVTLSQKVVRDCLRTELGYQGVVVTDDVGMHAMDDYREAPGLAADILNAGHDLIMLCAHWTDTRKLYDFAEAVLKAGQAQDYATRVLAPSRRRIEALLQRLPDNRPVLLPESVFEAHRALGTEFGGERAEVM
ncbi:glycoside hydrolase family 3 N-terminal domain-containing protein [Hoeflea olei]|uniref:Glycoside hydrolase family 3 N-terminal domain-containing protein n=1 Tax=Hoeflea olei TaxID=1480615 RepID=A0A1C1YTW0_9HYPH|nr:glycoside hydrolase family 3 N-terminal domain-containing protein [Hoeflea olei]OCW56978.1 hypothetical protein AWJ14_07435 [Hoeflea olei]